VAVQKYENNVNVTEWVAGETSHKTMDKLLPHPITTTSNNVLF
jgi:hypothetical protein